VMMSGRLQSLQLAAAAGLAKFAAMRGGFILGQPSPARGEDREPSKVRHPAPSQRAQLLRLSLATALEATLGLCFTSMKSSPERVDS